MTDWSQHGEYSEALAGYALGALPAEEADRVRRHLEECADCRAELDQLRVAVEALPASVKQVEPPPELKSRLMAIVGSEAELLRASGASADVPVARPRWRLPTPPKWPLLGLAAAAAAIVIVLLTAGGSSTRTVAATVVPQLRAVGARASLQVRGSRAQLVVDNLPTPPAYHVDELWVKHGQNAPRPAGTFVVQSGSVQVSRPVRAGDQVLVTVEPSPGTSVPTTSPLILARV